MYQQTGLFFYRFRYVFASLLTLVFLTFISAIVTAVGSNTILNTKLHPVTNALDTGVADSPNAVTDLLSVVAANTQHATLTTGTVLYGACRSITATTVQSGRSVTRGGTMAVSGIGKGTAFAARGVDAIVMYKVRAFGNMATFMLRLPGSIVRPIASVQMVSVIIKPTDDKPVPVISAETSATVLARLSAAQQQEISSLQAAQLVANQGLDGSIVAGDPDHGGYPVKWDNIAQDRTLDSWGMYNRECVSYAAWKVYQTYGDMPYWGGIGNANEWPGDARRAGIPTGSTPQVHSVAISTRGYYGHAMWVEKVSGDMIYVSQYNYDLHGHYSEMWVKDSYFTYIYFK